MAALDFRSNNLDIFFYLQVTLILTIKFQVSWLFAWEEWVQNRFCRWPPWLPSWSSDRNNFSYLWFASRCDTSYLVSSIAQGCRKSSHLSNLLTPHYGRRMTHDARWHWPTTIAHIENFVLRWAKIKCRNNWPSVQAKKLKIDFQDGHRWFSIGTIVASFDLQIIPILLNKFRASLYFDSGEEVENIFNMAAVAATLDFRSKRV